MAIAALRIVSSRFQRRQSAYALHHKTAAIKQTHSTLYAVRRICTFRAPDKCVSVATVNTAQWCARTAENRREFCAQLCASVWSVLTLRASHARGCRRVSQISLLMRTAHAQAKQTLESAEQLTVVAASKLTAGGRSVD